MCLSGVLNNTMSLFPNPSEDVFYELAKNNPELLEKWILSGRLRSSFLSFAVEALGSVSGDTYVSTLLKLSEHPNSLVREGVICTFSDHLDNAEVIETLQKISQQDANQEIRRIAIETLEDT